MPLALQTNVPSPVLHNGDASVCILYTSDAADDPLCEDPGGRPISYKNQTLTTSHPQVEQ